MIMNPNVSSGWGCLSMIARDRAFGWALLVLALCVFLPRNGFGADGKPVLLYSRYFNAEGEDRYLSDGTYAEVIRRLQGVFDVRVHARALDGKTLEGVRLLMIVNPSDQAVGTNAPPHHVGQADIKELTRFVQGGGGLIVMGNQENHNLEVPDMNRLLVHFGLQFTNLYTDAKKLVLPQTTPLIGGLRWGYYTGNLLLVDPSHPARPQGLVPNDLAQKPIKGTRDQEGILLATAVPGRGRVVAVTDAGWLANWALSDEGIGGLAITGQDNWEIFRRLAEWAAGLGKDRVPPDAKSKRRTLF